MTDARKRLLAGCLASALALALLAWAAFHAGGFRHLDARLLSHLSADRFGRPGDLADPVADLGNPVPQVLLLLGGLALALRGGRRDEALAGLVIVLGADLTTALPIPSDVLGGLLVVSVWTCGILAFGWNPRWREPAL